MSSGHWTGKVASRLFVWAQAWLERKNQLAAERIGERLGHIVYRLSRKHRERAAGNLRLAFPEWSDAQREQVARGVLEHFGRTMTDFMRARRRSKAELLASMEATGWEHIEAARAAGKGAILVTGHFGNWDRMAHWVVTHGVKLSVVARDVDDPTLHDLVRAIRQSAGVEMISRGNAARAVLACLRRNELVGILPDQNSSEIFVPFFGHPCGTVQGPAVLSLRSGSPIIPMYCVRTGPARYKVWIEPPLQPETGFEPVEGLTRALNRSLENAIRRAPDQYLWIHNRYKSARQRGLVP